ncbi:MAG: hypothetical protein QXJ28_02275, partial [Candidatus Pacearchaeota archaeon]
MEEKNSNDLKMSNNYSDIEKDKLLEELLKEREFHNEINSLLIHDLKSPATILQMAEHIAKGYFADYERATSDLARNEALFKIKRLIQTMNNASKRIVNLAGILRLGEVTAEEIKENSEEFNVLEQIRKTLQSYDHYLIMNKQGGLIFEYPSS